MLRTAQSHGTAVTANTRRPPRTGLLSRLTRDPSGIAAVVSRGVLLYSDKTLTCADCGQQFVFTASEQDFYAQRGFTEPRRCPTDRAARKAARQSSGAGYSSGYGDAGSYGGGGGYSSGGSYSSGGGGYDRGPREMFAATCSNCGNEARVPFRPTSGKPVYCSDCFRTMRG